MLNMLISFAASVFSSALLLRFVTDSVWIAMAVSMLIFLAVFVLITRIIMKKVGLLMQSAQKDVLANRGDRAVKSLQGGLKYGAWQFYVKQQIFSQIGSILYLKREFSEALPYLEKGFVRNWVSMSMLGISYMKKNKNSKMRDTFDKTIAGNSKEPMVYALYAYCLERTGEHGKAIEILQKGLKKTGGDERLSENIALLETGKRMKMKGFGDAWYQFHLEKPGAIIKKQTKAMTGRRKQVLR